MLEPVYYNEWRKKYLTSAVTGLWNRGPLKVLNGTKLIVDDQGNHLDSFRISFYKPFKFFRGPLFPKPVTGQALFLPLGIKPRL